MQLNIKVIIWSKNFIEPKFISLTNKPKWNLSSMRGQSSELCLTLTTLWTVSLPQAPLSMRVSRQEIMRGREGFIVRAKQGEQGSSCSKGWSSPMGFGGSIFKAR